MTPDNIMMDQIKRMHTKFTVAYDDGPRHLDAYEKQYRVACLMEELEEYAESDTMVGQYDALLDLLVFTLGTLERHGFPLQAGFDAVMAANMAKEVGNNPQKTGARGAYKGVDLVKPFGWKGPEDNLTAVLVARWAEKRVEVDPQLELGF